MMNEFNPDGKDIRFIDSHYRDLFRIPIAQIWQNPE